MQILTRKHRESVVVGGFKGVERLLKVTVLQIDPENVQLGFEIDPVVVARREVWAPMLIVTRKCRESVVVGGDDGVERLLKVTVLQINQGNVQLGFEVDPDVVVHRQKAWTPLLSTNLALR